MRKPRRQHIFLSVLFVASACAGAKEQVLDVPAMEPIDSQCDTLMGGFRWSEVAGAESYDLEYGQPGAAPTTINIAAPATSYTPPTPLAPGQWSARVRAVAGEVQSEFSQAVEFSLQATPVALAENDGPSCPGGSVQLSAADVPGATYQWTGPNGFSSTEQNPVIEPLDASSEGTYTLVVTVGECVSAAVDTQVSALPEQVYEQATSAQFATNINTDVVTAGDQVTLTSDLDVGDGSEGVFSPVVDTTLSGTHYFAGVSIPVGVTVRATGSQPLIIHSTGPVTIDGVLDASGGQGGDGVTFSTFGLGGTGVAGGGGGGNGVFSESTGQLPGNPGLGMGGGQGGTAWSGGGGGGHATAGADAGPNVGLGGPAYDTPELALLAGGSGGGGGSGGFNCGSGGGGAGGGVIVVSAPAITVNGAIYARGGNGGSDGMGNCGSGAGGSGGTIWLRASSLNINSTVSALGGTAGTSTSSGVHGVGGAGADGRIRLDFATLTLPGLVVPAAGYTGGLFSSPGTTLTTVTPASLCSWGQLSFTAEQPGTSSVIVDVLDLAGNVLIPDAQDGTDLSALTEPSLRLRATLSTTDQAPILYDWNVTYIGTAGVTP